MKIKIGIIQLCSGQNRDENHSKTKVLMEKAVRQGAQLLALPENFSFMGEGEAKLAAAENLENSPSYRFLQTFAAKHSVAIIGGTIPLKTANGKVSNTSLVFDEEGQFVARYDKIHLFRLDYDADNTHDESEVVEAGNKVVSVNLLGIKMGLSVCYDLRFPELYRILALTGADIIFVPAAFTVPTGKDHWEILLRARAIENQCYVVAPAQFGVNYSGRTTYGRSMVVGPWGQILAQCPDREDAIVCEIDLDYLMGIRSKLHALKDIRRSKFFS